MQGFKRGKLGVDQKIACFNPTTTKDQPDVRSLEPTMADDSRGKAWPLADADLTNSVRTMVEVVFCVLRKLSDSRTGAASRSVQATEEGCQ